MDKQREMFEAEFHLFDLRTEEEDGELMYIDDLTQGAWLGWQAAIAAQQGGIIAMPEPGTTEYGSWINKAKDKADQCFASHGEDRFKWLCQFEQHLRNSANGGEK